MASKRELAKRLRAVAGFDAPSPALEQYRTPPELAATLVHTAALQGDIADRRVVDLGCGTGMLGLAGALSGARSVVGIDVDRDALSLARDNEEQLAPEASVSWVRGDARAAPFRSPDRPLTVLMNPPFGAQSGNEHADKAFLNAAAGIAGLSYSIHNAGSVDFVESFASDHDGEVTHAFEAEFDLPHSFEFHTEESKPVDVEVFRIVW